MYVKFIAVPFSGDYFDHVLGWWQMRDDPHFLFVKYEDMKKVKEAYGILICQDNWIQIENLLQDDSKKSDGCHSKLPEDNFQFYPVVEIFVFHHKHC